MIKIMITDGEYEVQIPYDIFCEEYDLYDMAYAMNYKVSPVADYFVTFSDDNIVWTVGEEDVNFNRFQVFLDTVSNVDFAVATVPKIMEIYESTI